MPTQVRFCLTQMRGRRPRFRARRRPARASPACSHVRATAAPISPPPPHSAAPASVPLACRRSGRGRPFRPTPRLRNLYPRPPSSQHSRRCPRRMRFLSSHPAALGYSSSQVPSATALGTLIVLPAVSPASLTALLLSCTACHGRTSRAPRSPPRPRARSTSGLQ